MRKAITLVLVSSLAACDLDVPDLNNPGIGDLEDNPTASAVTSACTGLLIGNRRNQAAANGYVAQLSILGRDAYNFDQADPRFIGELLDGPLQPGSPFGGNFWAGPYANIRLGNTVLKAVDKVSDFSAMDKAAITGFVKTINAIDLLEVISTRDDIGAVVDTDHDIDDDLAPIVDKPAVLTAIAKLLDDGATALDGAGDAFPFALSSGYAGFDDPMTFRTFNRALRARVAAYQEDYDTVLSALAMSFIDPAATTQAGFDVGVYYSYSLKSGDATNNLINPNIFARPSGLADVQSKAGGAKDNRFTRKVAMVAPEDAGSAMGRTSNLVFTTYTSPESPVPLIRNEELILLRAEAECKKGMSAMAVTDLNVVRVNSGGLAAITGTPAEAACIDDVLYERHYSLLFEGGHRWIDLRRFGKEFPVDADNPNEENNIRYPVPLAECNARPGDAKCALDSTK
jgi:starch-binding outer membrane protein, SusD/RagB family